MGWRGLLRDPQAASRRAEREAYRCQRALQKQQQQFDRMQDFERAQHEVELYENRIALLTSVPKESGDRWNWKAIKAAPPPAKPVRSHDNERRAQFALTAYVPVLLDRFLGRAGSKRAELDEAVESARRMDKRDYRQAIEDFKSAMTDWEASRRFAARVLAGDLDAYTEAIRETDPFSDLSVLGSSIRFQIPTPHTIVSTLQVNSNRSIPQEIKTLLKTGRVSVKPMPTSRFFEIYQDYVCGCALRVARELFALLPVKMVVVTAIGEILNSATGHLEEHPILSAAVPRRTVDLINWETADPSDAMANFVHRMCFKRSKGLSPVEPIELSELQIE